jgi:2,5-diamino-6-(ribosylamino)-4(3H)-pyrimidinone 5'-phosphate reductase
MDKWPVTTLFMLSSVDGKISTGATDEFDVDKDFPRIDGVGQGLRQYYEIEQTTDLWSLNSGRTQAKIGVNERAMPSKTSVSFVLIDNRNLTEHGVRYFCALASEFVLVTTNGSHPAFSVRENNLHIIHQEKLNLRKMLETLRREYGCETITVQTGSTLNGLFLREKLFDYIDIIVAPILIGGKDTPSLIGGDSLASPAELSFLAALNLDSCEVLKDSYIRLRYSVRDVHEPH